MDSRRIRTVKELWTVYEHHGLEASTEALLERASEDVEVSPLTSRRTLRGANEVREYLDERRGSGVTLDSNAWSFDEKDDKVIVSATVRVHRPDGSLADTQIQWVFGFGDDDLVNRATFAPYGTEPT